MSFLSLYTPQAKRYPASKTLFQPLPMNRPAIGIYTAVAEPRRGTTVKAVRIIHFQRDG